MDPKDLDAVENELLGLIIRHLENNRMDVDTAQKLATDFLATLPIKNREDLLNKLKSLGQTYAEAKQVYMQEYAKDTTLKEQEALTKMSHAIRQGNIDHALTIAKDLKEGAK